MLLTAIVTNVQNVILITAAIELINLVIMVAKHIGAIVRLSARLVTLITAAIELINLVIMVAKHIGAIVRLSARLVILITAATELINLVIMAVPATTLTARLSVRLVILITAAIELINLVIMAVLAITLTVRLSARLVTDNCRNRTDQSCDYGCSSYYSDCSSKCQTCKSNLDCDVTGVLCGTLGCATTNSCGVCTACNEVNIGSGTGGWAPGSTCSGNDQMCAPGGRL